MFSGAAGSCCCSQGPPEAWGHRQQESCDVQQASAKSCKSFFSKRWGNSPFRLTILLQVTFLKKHADKIMVDWSLTGFKMFLVIH